VTFRDPALFELESSVIGAIFVRPDNLALLPEIEAQHFAHFKPRITFEAIRNLEHRGLPIDVTTVGDELGRVGQLEAVGWDFLGNCTLSVPTAENAVEYARRVRDHALRRRLLETLAEVLSHGRNGEHTGAELLTMALAGLSVLDAEQPEQAATIGEIVKRRIAQLEEIARERALGITTLSGMPSGIAELDSKLGGWQPGIMSIVAARPSMGKSSLGLATADACTAKGFGVHLFSLEDTESAYADRVMSRTSQVPAESIRNSTLARGQLDSLQRAVGDITRRTGWIVDGRSGVSAQEIVRSVRRHRRSNATRVVIVDYVQLVAKPNPRMTMHEALTEIATTFSDAAKQDGIAYVVMSQLNREIEKREDKRPQLSDLRESGALEERAKCVVGIYRGAAYGGKPKRGIDYPRDGSEPSEDEFERMVQLLVLKNNNGRTGTIRASWHGPTTRME
jgi:replicative DNA helicase